MKKVECFAMWVFECTECGHIEEVSADAFSYDNDPKTLQCESECSECGTPYIVEKYDYS